MHEGDGPICLTVEAEDCYFFEKDGTEQKCTSELQLGRNNSVEIERSPSEEVGQKRYSAETESVSNQFDEQAESLIAEWEAFNFNDIRDMLNQQQNITRENPVGIKESDATIEKVDLGESTAKEALMARVESNNFSDAFSDVFSSGLSTRLSRSIEEQIIGNVSKQDVLLAGEFKTKPATFSKDDFTRSAFTTTGQSNKFHSGIQENLEPLYRDTNILSKAKQRPRVYAFDKRNRFKNSEFSEWGKEGKKHSSNSKLGEANSEMVDRATLLDKG
jgi:hypothetical protein